MRRLYKHMHGLFGKVNHFGRDDACIVSLWQEKKFLDTR